jgi:phosphomannomutase
VELTDGIRVDRDGGWVLVLPDASDPTFNVFGEGPTEAIAKDYVDETATRIEQLARA